MAADEEVAAAATKPETPTEKDSPSDAADGADGAPNNEGDAGADAPNTEGAAAAGAADAGEKKAAAKPVPRPDRAKLDAKVDELMSGVQSAKDRITEISEAISRCMGDSNGVRAKTQGVRDVYHELITERRKIQAERTGMIAVLKQAKDRRGALIAQAKKQRESLKFSSIEAINERIQAMEMKQQQESMTLPAEKALLKEISELKKSRQNVDAYAETQKSIDKDKESTKATSERLNERTKDLEAVNAKLDASKAELDVADAEVKKGREGIPALREERDKLKAKIDAAYDEVRAVRKEYNKQKDEFSEYMNDVRKQRREASRLEREERQKEDDRLRAEEEAELLTRPPWEAEVALCDQLLAYTRKLDPVAAAAAAQAAGEDAASTPSSGGASAGARKVEAPKGMMMKSKKSDDEIFMQIGAKSKKQKGKKVKKGKPLTHALAVQSNFAELQMRAPSLLSDVGECHRKLLEWRQYFKTLPREAQPKHKPAKAGKKSVAKKPDGEGSGEGAGAGGDGEASKAAPATSGAEAAEAGDAAASPSAKAGSGEGDKPRAKAKNGAKSAPAPEIGSATEYPSLNTDAASGPSVAGPWSKLPASPPRAGKEAEKADAKAE